LRKKPATGNSMAGFFRFSVEFRVLNFEVTAKISVTHSTLNT